MSDVLIVAGAAALTALLILLLQPLLMRYALARPNARSSHTTPTPQGGGIAVIAAWLIASVCGLIASGIWSATLAPGLIAVFAATIAIAMLGAVDDIRTVPVAPRLLVQFLCVAIVIAVLPADFQMTPFLPWWLERALLVIAGVWFVNLVNFMDGLDWMTVAEIVPVAGGLVLAGWLGALPSYAAICALALLGAMIGFAPFNRPVARLFLGDVGSLPIGLVVGWLLALMANKGHLAAALLLPLYYLMDATITLFRRLSRREKVWQAHRTHFYQRATDNGFSVLEVTGAGVRVEYRAGRARIDLRSAQHAARRNRLPRGRRASGRPAADALFTKARMMRVLVTGASGFVGRALTRALSNADIQVRAAARNLSAVPSGANIEAAMLSDLAQPLDWRPLLRDVDAVVHLAGIAHVSNDIPDAQYDRANRLATKELALAAAMTPTIQRLVFVSSIRAQSGPVSDHVLTESDPPRPTDAYGRSKLAAEAFVRGYGVPATILRPVVIYGADARANVAQLVKIARLPLPLPFGAFRNRRSLLALDNMISAIRFVLDTPSTAGETYVVSDPSPVSLADMIAILRKGRGRAPGLIPVPPEWIGAALRTAGKEDVWERIGASLVADCAKLRAAGWQPPTDTPQALAELVRPPRP